MKVVDVIWNSEKNIHLRYILGLSGAIIHNGSTAMVDSILRSLSGYGDKPWPFDVSYSYLMSDAAGVRVTIKHWMRAMS